MIALLLALSIIVLGVILFKLWQFHALGVGRHGAIDRALSAWDGGDRGLAMGQLRTSRSHLAPVLTHALDADATLKPRLIAMAEARLEEVPARLSPAGQHRAGGPRCSASSARFLA